MGLVVEVCKELIEVLLLECRRSVVTRSFVASVAVLVLGFVTWGAWALLFADGQASGFKVLDVEGSVTYDDGGVIPVDMMLIKMFPAATGGKVSGTSMPVTARVDTNTGHFQAKWASLHGENQDLPLMWRVVVLSGNQNPFAEELVPREYGVVEETPLIVAMTDNPLLFRIRRPSATRP